MTPEARHERPSVAHWQSIDTAPKDGTDVLVLHGGEFMSVVWWDETLGGWLVAALADQSIYVDATHWAPLPPPPSALPPETAQGVPTYVYVVEQGAYSSRGVVGVYATPEAAMAAHPLPTDYKYPDPPTHGNWSRRGGWQPDRHSEPGYSWSNGLDWDDGKDITRYELETVPLTSSPTQEPEK